MAQDNTKILFDKFEIIECFKKDEHTGVYLANHIYLQKKIILKVLNTETIPDQVIIERFKREAKLLAKLNHNNIINVLDFGTFDEFFYISFEYFKGTSLRGILKKNKLNPEQKESLIAQMLNGLNCAHKHGIIHRDIKPENVFVNDECKLKIGDFGLAFDASENFVTSQFAVVGTPCYMSPEQVEGKRITPQSDLFSVGIVAFELFCGYNPLLGKDINETINKLSSFKEEILTEPLGVLPDYLSKLISGLLKKDKDDRISSAEEALAYLNIVPEDADDFKKKDSGHMVWSVLIFITAAASVIIVILIMSGTVEETPPVKETPSTVIDSAINKNIDTTLAQTEQSNTGKHISSSNPTQEDEKTVENIINYGSLKITCFPWVDVFIDSVKIETTPLNRALVLSEGEHELRLFNPRYPEYKQTLRVSKGELINVQVNLDTLWGFVNFNIYPWGEVTIDDKPHGVTPFNEPVKLYPGSHTAIIKNPGAGQRAIFFDLTQNDTLLINHNFEIN